MGRAQDFVEIADRCFMGRYAEWDVTIGVVVGTDGVLVVDTRATARQGHQLRDDVRRLAPRTDIRWVVNTHQHFDHTFGNVAFDGATIHAHENAAAGLGAAADRIRALIRDDPRLSPERPEITREVLDDVLDTELRPPDVTFSSVAALDLGDRFVELIHPGRGHTDGDIVVRVPDSEVMFAGDLVEESGPPMFGVDSFPMDWPGALDLMLGLAGPGTVVVPGHGAAVDLGFVQGQRTDISDTAELIRSLNAQGVPVEDALRVGGQTPRPQPLAAMSDQAEDPQASAASGWPFPPEMLADAVRRGYAQLDADVAPRTTAQPLSGASTLPLV